MGKVKDIITRVAKVAASYIPGVGPVVSEIIDFGSNAFEQNKLQKFMESVEVKLEKHSEQIEKIKSDEFGYFYFLKATKRWIEDSQSEKLEYFANAVENGYTADISEAKKLLFLTKLAEYPVELLELLDYLNEDHFVDASTSNHKIYYGTKYMKDALCEGLPKYRDQLDLLDNFVNILIRDNFTYLFTLNNPEEEEKAKGKWTTKFGEEFIAFIKERK